MKPKSENIVTELHTSTLLVEVADYNLCLIFTFFRAVLPGKCFC